MSETEQQQSTSDQALRCPRCKSDVDPAGKTMPFCSERCRMADLGKWFDGSYTISRGLKPEDLDELEA